MAAAKAKDGDSKLERAQRNGSETVYPKQMFYENTYKIKPDRRFDISLVKKIVKEELVSVLKNEKYEQARCREYCLSLSQSICDKIKSLGFDRHKIVCMVTIGERKNQGLRIGSRCLWNTAHDNWADFVYELPDMFAHGIVFGVNLD